MELHHLPSFSRAFHLIDSGSYTFTDTKLGNRRLRTALFFPAVVAMRSHPFFAALAARHLARGQSKMSTVGILMHKLIRIIFGVLKSGQPFDLAALTA